MVWRVKLSVSFNFVQMPPNSQIKTKVNFGYIFGKLWLYRKHHDLFKYTIGINTFIFILASSENVYFTNEYKEHA